MQHLISALLGLSVGRVLGKIGCFKLILMFVLFPTGLLAIAVLLSLDGQEIKGWFEPEPISKEAAEYRKCISEIPDNRTDAEKKAGTFDSMLDEVWEKCK
ncbi:MAG: hypothetical protein AAFV90_24160 [Cyanobacteria bacterium J06634_5]